MRSASGRRRARGRGANERRGVGWKAQTTVAGCDRPYSTRCSMHPKKQRIWKEKFVEQGVAGGVVGSLKIKSSSGRARDGILEESARTPLEAVSQ